MIKISSEDGASYIIKHYHEPVSIVEPTHKTEFSPKELYDSFTSKEALLALRSSNSDVVTQAQLLSFNRGVIIQANDADYQSSINLLESDGVLSPERAAAYRSGIPIS
jgi:hypothetical protein